eukprot:10317253-Ditylum_brightwellii.AAC.1
MLETKVEATENKRLQSPRSTQDEELIIKMDANDIDQANSDFRKFHSKCNLVDFVAHLHPGITLLTHINVVITE